MNSLHELSVLYVEDEAKLREQVTQYLELYCGKVLPVGSGAEALELFARWQPDLVLTDLRLGAMDGLELTQRLRDLVPLLPVVLCTAFVEVDCLLRAIELGVSGVVRKPLVLKELLAVVTRAAQPALQRRELEKLQQERLHSTRQSLGTGPAALRLAEEVLRAASCDFNVLLLGETGVGKTRLAGMLHRISRRREGPFLSLHVGSLPESLLASELFGHERGAFTGADRRREGLFEAARGGTLLLDDIDTVPSSFQAKLLEVVETKTFLPIGGRDREQTDVRLLAASNQDLAAEVTAGRFRQDLYYRLCDLVLTIPPLRERSEDIPDLAHWILQETAGELGAPPVQLEEGALALLQTGGWPGNIRELRSVLRRAVLVSDGRISVAELQQVWGGEAPPSSVSTGTLAPPASLRLVDLERWAVERGLQAAGGKRMKAAELLGVTYKTYRAMMERHGVR